MPGDDNNLQAKRTLAYNGDGQILLQRRWWYDSGTWKQGAREASDTVVNKFRGTISDVDWAGEDEADRVLWYQRADNTRATYVSGQQVATHTEAGNEFNVNGGLTGFSNTRMGRTQVQVQQGDTLKTLAQRIYGSEALWYVLADANGLAAAAPLPAAAADQRWSLGRSLQPWTRRPGANASANLAPASGTGHTGKPPAALRDRHRSAPGRRSSKPEGRTWSRYSRVMRWVCSTRR